MNKDGVCVPIFNGSMGLVKEIIDTNVIVDFEGIGEIVLTIIYFMVVAPLPLLQNYPL